MPSFAVRRRDLLERADVSYAAGASLTRQALAGARFPLVSLGELAASIQYGSSARATEDTDGVPIIRMNNIQDDGWALDDLKYIGEQTPDLSSALLERGDLLINRTNTKELVGKAAVWRTEGRWAFASYLIRIRVDEDRVLPDFLSAVLNSALGRVQIDQLSRQIAGMTNINVAELRTLRTPLPPLETQRQLVSELRAARAHRDETERKAVELATTVAHVVARTLSIPPVPTGDATAYGVNREALRVSGRLDPAAFHPGRVRVRRMLESLRGAKAERVGEIAHLRAERGSRADAETYIGLANVESGTGNLIASDVSDSPGAGIRFTKGDILYGRLRPRLNKVWLADRTGVCSTEFRPLRVTMPDVSNAYLALALLGSTTMAQTVPLAAGNTHPRLSDTEILDVVVPVPPRHVQQRVETDAKVLRQQASQIRSTASTRWRDAKANFAASLTRAQLDE